MMGAAFFSTEAAYRSGCGLVKALVPADQSLGMTLRVPEAVQIIYKDPSDFTIPEKISSVILGPGLGKQEKLFYRIMTEIPASIPMIIDADGLNLLAQSSLRRANTIMTPHFGEASRLLGKPISELTSDPLSTAREIAEKYQSTVVLKNVPGMIVAPDGRAAENHQGNPGMSTAGSGDVLSGIIGGLLAQPSSLDLWEIAVLGAWLHGSAGNAAAKVRGQHALMASDLLEYLRPDLLVAE